MDNNSTHHVKSVVADPTALGLGGLALVTFVAASQKLGITEGTALVIPWAIFMGAVAQLIAGFFDFKHNNLFGAVTFTTFGLFWLGVSFTWMIIGGWFGEDLASSFDIKQFGVALIGFFIIAIFLTIATFRLNAYLAITMLVIDVLLVGLMLDTLGAGWHWHTIAAVAELGTALLSFYGVGAALLNKIYGRVMLPMGKPWAK